MDKKESKHELNEINLDDENLTELSDEEKEKENFSKNSLLNQKRDREKNHHEKEKKIIIQNNNKSILNNELCKICKKNNKMKINSFEELIDFVLTKFDCNKENKKKLLENKNHINENLIFSICENCLLNEILFNGFNKFFNKNDINKEIFNYKERNFVIEKIEKINEILEKNTNNLESIMNKMALQLMLSKFKDKFQKFNEEVNSCIEVFKNQKNTIIQIMNDLKDKNNNFQNNENYTILGYNNNNNLEQNLFIKNLEHDLFGEKNYKINNYDNKKINFNINNINNIDTNDKTNLFINNQDSMSFPSKPNKNYIIKSLFPIHETKSNNYGTFKETQIDKINIENINNNDTINLLSNFNIFNNKPNDIQKQIEILNKNLKEKSSDKKDINNINNDKNKKNNNFLNKNLEVEGIELDFSKNILKNENTDFNNNTINNINFALNKNLDSLLFNKNNINDDNSFYNLKNLLQLNNNENNNFEYFNKNILFNNNELFDKMSNYNNLFFPSITNQNNLNFNFLDNSPLIPNFNNNNFLHPPSFSSENNNNNQNNLKEKLDQGISNMLNEYLRANNINQDNYPQRKNIKIEDLFTNNQSNLFPNFFE